MTRLIREGTLEEVIQVVARITEFTRGETLGSLAERLADKKSLILVSENAGVIFGFKIGYALDNDTFYSWLGGVAPEARNESLAQRLLETQEEWVAEHGYKTLKVKSRNQFPAMLRCYSETTTLLKILKKSRTWLNRVSISLRRYKDR